MSLSNDAGKNGAPVNQAQNRSEETTQRSEVGGQRSEDQNQGRTLNPQRPTPNDRDRQDADATTSAADVAEHLNLPPEVAKQIRESGTQESRNTATAEGLADDADDTPAATAGDRQGADATEGEGEESNAERPMAEHRQDGDATRSPKAPKNWPPEVRAEFEKRIGKIWKQKSTAEERATQAEELATQFQTELDNFRAQAQEAASAAPGGPGILGKAQTERQLNGMVSEAEAMIDLLDANPDWLQAGYTSGEGEKAVFHDPAKVAGWKRDAERVLRGAETRRRQIREFTTARQGYDAAAQKEFPELFDKTTKEFQTAVAIANRYPWIRGIPEANYALGVMVEGFKAIEGRKKTPNAERRTPNGRNAETEGDLDERLDPEYQRTHIPPTAPANQPQPPSRGAGPTAQRFKRVEQMAERFTRPGGANVEDLADILREVGNESTSTNGEPNKRKLVAV